MHVEFEDCGSAVLIRITANRLDSATATPIRDALRTNVSDSHDIYLFDFSNVTFIDSTGIGTLVGFMKYVGRKRRVELCALNPAVHKVLRLTNLLSVFTIHQDVEDGLIAHRAFRPAANS